LTAEQREQLLLEHLPSVRFIARRIHQGLPQHVELEDLISAGTIGLIDAFNKFDAAKNVKFKSYAQFRIRGAILDSLRELDWGPRELRRKGRAVDETVRSLTMHLGRAPSESEVAEHMELSLAEYQQLVGDIKSLEIGTLHAERNEDAGDEEMEYLAAPAEESPLAVCLKGERRSKLADAIDELPDRERTVLSLYYVEELTMKEIGEVLGVVESRVSQIHSAAISHLRSVLGPQQGNARRASRTTRVTAA
jgi:RNA polymerase sigma factor for flagellar operon FliA